MGCPPPEPGRYEHDACSYFVSQADGHEKGPELLWLFLCLIISKNVNFSTYTYIVYLTWLLAFLNVL